MSIDLETYFARIGYRTGAASSPAADLSTLVSLHGAHLAAIPFENIDVWLGREILLDTASLERKLLRRRRGGYCFEHNTLFAAVLRSLGFEVATLEARVRPPEATATLPRTHMVLEVALEGGRWLADVGFGGDGPLLPVPMDGEVSRQADGSYRIVREADENGVLQRGTEGGWGDLYAFSSHPALPIDFEVANHYTSTHPNSVFRRTLTVQRSESEARYILRGRSYVERHGSEETRREIDRGEIVPLLEDVFGLDLRLSESLALQALD